MSEDSRGLRGRGKGMTGGGPSLVKGLEESILEIPGAQSGKSCLGRELRPENVQMYVLEGEKEEMS